MRPVLFLDIDGVLNHADAYARYGEGLILAAHSTEVLDPACVEQLNRVVTLTECEVVVSSTWRLVHTLILLETLLQEAGYEHYLLSTTPDLPGNHKRGREIAAWLKRHPGYGPIAIVDDDSDMEPFMSRWVKTHFNEGGLTERVADQLIELLTENTLARR